MKKRLLAMVGCVLFLTGCTAERVQETVAAEEACYVALTFDDGPSEYTEALLDGLKERGVHATFFLIGSQIEGREDLVRRMAAEGHQVGNHSYDHANLEKINTTQALEDLERCDALLQELLGDGCYWVRPPYGLIRQEDIGKIPAPLVCWSVDSEDWKLRDTQKVLQRILKDAEDGDIILMHDPYPTSVEAALQLVDQMLDRGVEFVTVEELLQAKGTTPVCGKIYRKA